MTNTTVEAFVEVVRRYCRFIEHPPRDLGERLRTAAALLAELYSAVLQLPDMEPLDSLSAGPADSQPEWPGFGEFDGYWEVFDPYEQAEPLMGSLSDDVLDVYRDLRRGLRIYDSDGPNAVPDAVWEWQFHREAHWGDHAVDALRALQRAIQRVAG